jgi:hypothetical protein
MHHFILEINTNGIQSGYEGSQVHLTVMDRAEDPVCTVVMDVFLPGSVLVMAYTVCKFGSLRFCLMSIFIALSFPSSSLGSFPLNLSGSGISQPIQGHECGPVLGWSTLALESCLTRGVPEYAENEQRLICWLEVKSHLGRRYVRGQLCYRNLKLGCSVD